MSNLKTVEKKCFEDIFYMGGGYVLDFSNNTFAEFFRETVQINIYSPKYEFNGDSKAKRLRAFWEIEPDPTVGKVLSELLEVWLYNHIEDSQSLTNPLYIRCRDIASRLLGKEIKEEDSEEQFLKKNYRDISLSNIPIESSLIPILESRLAEAQRCLKSNSPLAAIFMCGSILEGVLLGVALQKPQEFNKNSKSPKDKTGKVKAFQEWTLSQFIDVAYEIGLLKLDVKKFSHGLREFRNFIHPYQQMALKFDPDKHTGEICLQVLNAAITSLSGERKN